MSLTLLFATLFVNDPRILAAIDRARAATTVETPCRAGADEDEIVVCARRDADRFRAPIVTATPGDPRAVDAWGERHRLLAVPQLPCGIGAFLSGCGSVGVSVSTRTGVSAGQLRPLAP